MSKVRINDLARELEVKSRAILDVLEAVGVTEKKTHSSSLEEDEAERVRAHLQRGKSASAGGSRAEAAPRPKIDLSQGLQAGRCSEGHPAEERAGGRAPQGRAPLRRSRSGQAAPPRPQRAPRPYPLCPPPRRKPQSRPRAGLFRSRGRRAPIISKPPQTPAIAAKPPAGPVVVKPPVGAAAPPAEPRPAIAAAPPAGPVVAKPPVTAHPPAPRCRRATGHLSRPRSDALPPLAPAAPEPPAVAPRRVIMPQTGPRPVYTAPKIPRFATAHRRNRHSRWRSPARPPHLRPPPRL